MAAESSASEIRVHLPCVQREREKKHHHRCVSDFSRLAKTVSSSIFVDRPSRESSRINDPFRLILFSFEMKTRKERERESERFGKAPGSRYRKFRRIVMQHLQRGCK